MKWKQSETENSEKNNDNCCLFIKNVFLRVSDVSAKNTKYAKKIANDTPAHNVQNIRFIWEPQR